MKEEQVDSDDMTCVGHHLVVLLGRQPGFQVLDADRSLRKRAIYVHVTSNL